ncbi:hypothetical protein T492DRAFT_1124289 [Pavlovales sp. CCMP2436]|nr:hypothetical protein T492DRAFT_1124289 [Pavlovales sp. CCMP2436]
MVSQTPSGAATAHCSPRIIPEHTDSVIIPLRIYIYKIAWFIIYIRGRRPKSHCPGTVPEIHRHARWRPNQPSQPRHAAGNGRRSAQTSTTFRTVRRQFRGGRCLCARGVVMDSRSGDHLPEIDVRSIRSFVIPILGRASHKRTHSGERPFACDEPGCEYSAAEAGHKTHKRTHSGERPYACDEPGCDFRASTTGSLKAHKRTHSGELPYPCDEPGCTYRTTTAGSLTTHKCTHSGERPFPCDEPGCSFSATTASNLKTHKRNHSGERPYSCDEPGCEYQAAEARNLVGHKRTHSGERPYACDEPGCEYRAAEAGNLASHKRTHSGERPYPCDEAAVPVRRTGLRIQRHYCGQPREAQAHAQR